MSSIRINNLNNIREAADEFIQQLGKNKILAFEGTMGAGKTTFIKAICENLEVTDVINSPTFAIVNEYYSEKLKDKIYHFDFYRIKNIREAIDLGTEEYLYSGSYCFIEWPGMIGELLPPNTVFVKIKELENGEREVCFSIDN